jgi:hypothetical protein
MLRELAVMLMIDRVALTMDNCPYRCGLKELNLSIGGLRYDGGRDIGLGW